MTWQTWPRERGAGIFYQPLLAALEWGLALGGDLYLTVCPVLLTRDGALRSGGPSPSLETRWGSMVEAGGSLGNGCRGHDIALGGPDLEAHGEAPLSVDPAFKCTEQ